MFANPLTTLMWAGIYIFAGLIWSIKEWYSYVKDRAEYYTKTESLVKEFRFTEKEIKDNLIRETDITKHWDDITTWIVYFPYFVLAWALTDPIKLIAEQFAFVYKRIANSVTNKAINNIIKERTSNDINNRDKRDITR